MIWNEHCYGVVLDLRLKIKFHPIRLMDFRDEKLLVSSEWTIIKIGCIARSSCIPCAIKFNELQPAGYNSSLSGMICVGILDRMFEEYERPDLIGGIILINKDCPLCREIAVLFKNQIDNCIEQWMTGTDECGNRFARYRNLVFLECNSFIS